MSSISFPVFSQNSFLKENCIWVYNKGHYVCMTYKYYPTLGKIKYGASITDGTEPDAYSTQFTENLTVTRYKQYPVQKIIEPNLEYYSLIERLIFEISYGFGCYFISDNELETYNYTEDPVSIRNLQKFTSLSSRKISRLKTVHHVFSYTADKKPIGKLNYYNKDYYISFRGTKTTGEIEYGMCMIDYDTHNNEAPDFIKHYSEESMFDNSDERLFYCPISMTIPHEFRHQLDRHSEHHEDIMYCIIDHFNNYY